MYSEITEKGTVCHRCKVDIPFCVDEVSGKKYRIRPKLTMETNNDQYEFCSPECICTHYALAGAWEILPFDTDFTLPPEALIAMKKEFIKREIGRMKKM